MKNSDVIESQPDNFNLDLGKRLKETREVLEITQGVFASELKLMQSYYQLIEKGKKPIRSSQLAILYRKYSINPVYLLAGNMPVFLDGEYLQKKESDISEVNELKERLKKAEQIIDRLLKDKDDANEHLNVITDMLTRAVAGRI